MPTIASGWNLVPKAVSLNEVASTRGSLLILQNATGCRQPLTRPLALPLPSRQDLGRGPMGIHSRYQHRVLGRKVSLLVGQERAPFGEARPF